MTTWTCASRCIRARASSADLYAAMPPPTPRTTLLGGIAGHDVQQRILGQDLVLHEASPDLFHGDDGRLLGGGGKERTSAVLQLARALGGYDDESVDALLRIVGDGTVRIILWGLF